MALINCEECGRQISSLASTCPHCGYPITPNSEAVLPLAIPSIPEPRQPKTVAAPKTTPTVTMPNMGDLSLRRVVWLIGALLLLLALIHAFNTPIDTSTSAPLADSSAETSDAAAAIRDDIKKYRALTMQDKTATPQRRLRAAQKLIKSAPDSPEGEKAKLLLKELTDAVASDSSGKRTGESPVNAAITAIDSTDTTAKNSRMLTVDAGGCHAPNQKDSEMFGLILNLNSLLCAKVTKVCPLKVSNALEVTCIEYRGGSATKTYIVDTKTAVAFEQ